MATITSAQAGNWSATSTWVGGVVPVAADTAIAAHNVTLDVDVTVAVLDKSGTGTFILGNGRTVTATTSVNGPSAAGFTITCNATTSATINSARINMGTNNDCYGVTMTGTGTLNINATVGNPATSKGGGGVAAAIYMNGLAATLNVTGDVYGGALNNTILGIATNSSCTINITGNVFGTTSASGFPAISSGTTPITINVVGNVTGGAPGNCPGINTSGANATINVTGNVTGGVGVGSVGVAVTGASALVTVVGNVTGTGTTGNGISSSATAGGVVITGNMTDNQAGGSAVYARLVRRVATINSFTRYANNAGYPTGGTLTYGSLDYIPNNIPVPADVRFGTVYGNNTFTGTLRVPPTNSVASGVPVDNTTGTAALRPSDIAGLVGAQIAAALSQ